MTWYEKRASPLLLLVCVWVHCSLAQCDDRRMRTKPGESSRVALSSEPFPLLLWVGFKISTNVRLNNLNPGKCYQPNVTPGKLKDMYNSVRKKLGTATTNFKKSGMRNPFWDVCSGDLCMPWGSGAGQRLCVLPILRCPCAVAKQSCGHVQYQKQSCAGD